MRMSLPLPLGLTLGITAGVLALAPVASAAAKADGPPTYTCQTDGPAPRLAPPWIHGVDCKASDGAPTSGVARGPVKLVIDRPRFTPPGVAWVCQRAEVLDGSEPGALRVMGNFCEEQRN